MQQHTQTNSKILKQLIKSLSNYYQTNVDDGRTEIYISIFAYNFLFLILWLNRDLLKIKVSFKVNPPNFLTSLK